ncbi:J domain-containing protein [Vibrio sp. PNB22_3_1]
MKITFNQAVELLELSVPFSKQEAKRGYKKAMLTRHPDKNGDHDSAVALSAALKLALKHATTETSTERSYDWHRAYAQNEGHPLHRANIPSTLSYESLLAEYFTLLKDVGRSDDLFDTTSSIRHHGFYYRDSERDFHVSCAYGNWSSFTITDVTHGGRIGKTCQTIRFNARRNENDFSREEMVTNYLREIEDNVSLTQLFDAAQGNDISLDVVNQAIERDNPDQWGRVSGKITLEQGLLEFFIDENKSTQVMNPFTFREVFKPLKTAPKKWKIRDMIKVLVNGQYRELKSHYYYTDDYAMDSALDFRKGFLNNPFFVVKDWFGQTKLSCTRLSANGEHNEHVSFGAHSNESKGFVFVPTNRFSVLDLEQDVKAIESNLSRQALVEKL